MDFSMISSVKILDEDTPHQKQMFSYSLKLFRYSLNQYLTVVMDGEGPPQTASNFAFISLYIFLSKNKKLIML